MHHPNWLQQGTHLVLAERNLDFRFIDNVTNSINLKAVCCLHPVAFNNLMTFSHVLNFNHFWRCVGQWFRQVSGLQHFLNKMNVFRERTYLINLPGELIHSLDAHDVL